MRRGTEDTADGGAIGVIANDLSACLSSTAKAALLRLAYAPAADVRSGICLPLWQLHSVLIERVL